MVPQRVFFLLAFLELIVHSFFFRDQSPVRNNGKALSRCRERAGELVQLLPGHHPLSYLCHQGSTVGSGSHSRRLARHLGVSGSHAVSTNSVHYSWLVRHPRRSLLIGTLP